VTELTEHVLSQRCRCVVRPGSAPFDGDESCLAEDPEVVRDCRLPDRNLLDQVADAERFRVVGQEHEEPEPCLVSQCTSQGSETA